MLTCAWVTINVLRRVLDCRLPIELWHIGPRELGSLEASLFSDLEVEIVDALDRTETWPARKLGGWELKAYALVHSRFSQALLLDADNLPVVDPTYLFTLPELAETGTLAWPDLERLTEQSRIWDLCGVPFRSEPAWESGQLLVDKSRSWQALVLALHMNMHSEAFYPHTQGDKETFHLAWLLAQTPWSMPPHPARRTVYGIAQRDFAGDLLFQHRSSTKWRLHGPNPAAENFQFEADCLAFLADLATRWSGRIDLEPPAAPADVELEGELLRTGWVTISEPGADDRLLELLHAHRIGIGASRRDALRWYVRDEVLTIHGGQEALPELHRESDDPLTFAAVAGRRPLRLRASPDLDRNAISTLVAAVLNAVSPAGPVTEDDAVTTLSTLAMVGDLDETLARSRARSGPGTPVARVIERVQARAGFRPPPEQADERIGYEPLP